MDSDISHIGGITFIWAGLAYLGLGGYLLVSRQHRRPSEWPRRLWAENLCFIGAMGISALWAFAASASFYGMGSIGYYLFSLDVFRAGAWIVFLGLMLSRIWAMQGDQKMGRILFICLGGLLGLAALTGFLEVAFYWGLWATKPSVYYSIYASLGLCIVIFLLVENLYRNSAVDGRWGIKLLLLGIGALYVYDFLMFADTLLFTAIGQKLFEARGMINFILVPVLGLSVLRNPNWKLNVKLSRKVAFHTVTLIGTGAYLIGMAAVGYFLQNFGGKWGNLLQATFVLIALLGLMIFITSGRIRALIQVFLTKHFFQYRYDYREEWLKLITTISTTGEHYDLRERVIKALADVMESPGGALWLREQPDVYHLTARWNCQDPLQAELSAADPFVGFLEQTEWIVDLNSENRENKALPKIDSETDTESHPVPGWLLDNRQCWLVLPLIHLGKLVGFVVLLQPRVKNNLNWESIDLLRIIGRQLASYMAEQIAEISLAESREFESFNRKFAFVVHDIKNLTSQLSLMVRNAEKHVDNPEFRKDMVLTIQDSVAKMQNLLSRITVVQEPAKEKKNQQNNDHTINISQTLKTIVDQHKTRDLTIHFYTQADRIMVHADPNSIETVFMHLIENAREACDPATMRLDLSISREDGFALIRFSDNGHGMAKDFIRNELFRPFRSTKQNGYGIGAYESREMIKRLGGRLDVKSSEGAGTTIKIYLKTVNEKQRV